MQVHAGDSGNDDPSREVWVEHILPDEGEAKHKPARANAVRSNLEGIRFRRNRPQRGGFAQS